MALLAMYLVSCDCCWQVTAKPEDATITALEAHLVAQRAGWQLGDQGDRCPACIGHRVACHEQPIQRAG